ncbi:sensor domain-containing diguanylate cyclase [Mangrovibacter yixingensis]|uniref:sensor domain-containing diguanylate cyclase n=1 Tax=Mangrovibacter yixingensis TaxID=1529639 RepID=UPI001CFA8EC4|nr:diguanylate cyclase [Mangrovibacter yixingensis]
MKQWSFVISHQHTLSQIWESKGLLSLESNPSPKLVFIYTGSGFDNLYAFVQRWLKDKLDNVEIIGVTTGGHFMNDAPGSQQLMVSITLFEQSYIQALPVNMQPPSLSTQAINQILHHTPNLSLVMLLSTTVNDGILNTVLNLQLPEQTQLFGGVVSPTHSIGLLCGNDALQSGFVLVLVQSQHLHCRTFSYTGWLPMSINRRITDAQGSWIKSIDNLPAFEVYHNYTTIENDSQFAHDALAFPVLLPRRSLLLSRVPIEVNNAGHIRVAGDVLTGEDISFGYGDAHRSLAKIDNWCTTLTDFAPEVLFGYSCTIRNMLFADYAWQETMLAGSLAPLSGFVTWGEYSSVKGKVTLNNTSLLMVALREGEASPMPTRTPFVRMAQTRPSMMSRLVNFMHVASEEFRERNQQLNSQAQTDKLTGLYNRYRLDSELLSLINQASNTRNFSLVLMDIDHFKQVNDMYGHQTGDIILRKISELVCEHLRWQDIAGRWGGEEFMLLITESNKTQLIAVLKRLQQAIAHASMPFGLTITCSFGATHWQPGDDEQNIVQRADIALYDAKNQGRNRFVIG